VRTDCGTARHWRGASEITGHGAAQITPTGAREPFGSGTLRKQHYAPKVTCAQLWAAQYNTCDRCDVPLACYGRKSPRRAAAGDLTFFGSPGRIRTSDQPVNSYWHPYNSE
jgi:hypothetical protein